MKRIAVYGSLREGEYNSEAFKGYYPNQITFVGSQIIKGFDLFDLGSYPGIQYSTNEEQPLVVDLLECSDECANSIDRMERGANYTPKDIDINGQWYTIYIYRGIARKKVESGDWSKYLREKEEQYA